MANFDRAKNDRGRDEDVFVGGEDGDDHENEGSHLPVVIIIAILVLAAFGGVVWLAYNQGVARGRNDVPVRVAATQTAKTDDTGLKVYQQSAGPEDGDAKAAPTTPQPATPPPVQAQAQTPAPAQAQTPPPPVQSAPVQPVPKTVAQAAPPPVMTPPAPKPQQMAAAKPAPAKPAAQDLAPPQPQVATKPPTPLNAAHPAAQTPVTPAATPLKPATLKPVAEAPVKAAAAGSYFLQIGAYKSDEEARTAWKAYQSKHATLLSGFGPDVQRTTHDDGSVWYRLRIASFADKDAAAALCERLKAQGGTCFLAK